MWYNVYLSVGLLELCGYAPATIHQIGSRISGANWQPGAVAVTYNISRLTDKTGLSDVIPRKGSPPSHMACIICP